MNTFSSPPPPPPPPGYSCKELKKCIFCYSVKLQELNIHCNDTFCLFFVSLFSSFPSKPFLPSLKHTSHQQHVFLFTEHISQQHLFLLLLHPIDSFLLVHPNLISLLLHFFRSLFIIVSETLFISLSLSHLLGFIISMAI
jgi:hypothetical protein